jgi:D-alanine-D-alanine ligase
MMNFGRVVVLMGGPSAEREVSLKSGNAVLQALQGRGVDAVGLDAGNDVLARLSEFKPARVFIALHGRFGEDGVIQGALEVLGIPYTGSGVLGSALGMDKLRSKKVWASSGIPVAEQVVIGEDYRAADVVAQLGLPIFVKPAHEGSSIGVTKVSDAAQLEAAVVAARRLDGEVFAERGIVGAELTVAILGERALPVIRLETPRTFYDYEAKYSADSTRYHCPSGLEAALEHKVQALALEAFRTLGCRGWGRVDVMLDVQERPYFLEVNTVPGMTDHSLVPMAARAAGMSFSELCLRILETAR